MTAIQPAAYRIRSPVYRRLEAAGAVFTAVGAAALAATFGDRAGETRAARTLGVADLSALPRVGFKGRGAVEWLTAQGAAISPAANVAAAQSDGARAVRLSASEVLILPDRAGRSGLAAQLEAAWHRESRRPRGYLLMRADTHAWFCVTGTAAPALFAKLCAVDLRVHRFARDAVAQTVLAQVGAIIVRGDIGPIPAFDVLADWAAADYLLPVLADAMAEFSGRLIGLDALAALAADGGT
jgi:sarcosine oxidase subunit gamma